MIRWWWSRESVAALVLFPAFLFGLSRAAVTGGDTDFRVRDIVAGGIAPVATANDVGGLASAVYVAGHTQFFNYGFADREERRPITSDSLFNVASVRKVFEATLVALGKIRGELSLDDPVSKYVTELHGDYIRRVTIGELATHTSGLLLATDHPPWPDASYSLAEFLDTLNNWVPRAGEEPGKQRIYTHAGYVLLQLALERRYGVSIDELVESRILRPLHMNSTLIPRRGPDNRAIMSPALMQRAVQGYAADGMAIGSPGNQQSYYDFPGTGQMFSSARDLAIFLAACLGDGVVDPELSAALLMTQREMFRVGEEYGQAMAWETIDTEGVRIIDKPGGLNNASAYLGLVPRRKVGLLWLANRAEFPYDLVRHRVLPALSRL